MAGFEWQSFSRLILANVALNSAGWAAASALQTEKFFDITGSATYWLMLYLGVKRRHRDRSDLTPRAAAASAAVLVWSGRLGTFLLSRVLADGQDKRFKHARKSPAQMAMFWAVQSAWVTMTALPVWLLLSRAPLAVTPRSRGATTTLDRVAAAAWIVGFATQIVADAQKREHRASAPGKFISTGLWKLSQHPNYAGEITMWTSLCAACMGDQLANGALAAAAASALSPAFVYYLLRYVSGVPLLDNLARKRWGKDAAFHAYRAGTPVLFWM